MKDMNWPERVAYLENQLADSDRDNQRLREFIEGLPDGDEIVRLRGLLAETNAKMMILHNESISLHARLAEATGIISQRALELADTQGQLTEAKRKLARWAKLNPLAQQIADPTLRGIVVSFLDRFGYGASEFDMQAGINRAMAAAKKHTPECSYWDGLMAQVCNCGLTGGAVNATCKHGEAGSCFLCDEEDREHDAAMDASFSASEKRDATSAQLAEEQRFIHGAAAVTGLTQQDYDALVRDAMLWRTRSPTGAGGNARAFVCCEGVGQHAPGCIAQEAAT